MGDIFQFEWVQSFAGELAGPVLEIGSKRYGGPPVFFDYRRIFPPGIRYLGIDMEPGEGVDQVLDMTSELEEIRRQLAGETFNSLICMSVLEHVKDIFSFARNMTALLNEGGTAILSVPFSWGIHSYPDDYWRFTPHAVRVLFPNMQFEDRRSWLHTASGRKKRLDEPGDFNQFVTFPAAAGSGAGGFPGIIENTMCDMVGTKGPSGSERY